jgi:hypothetical protein
VGRYDISTSRTSVNHFSPRECKYYSFPLKELKIPLPLEIMGISSCNFSIKPFWEMKKPASNKSILYQTEIHVSNRKILAVFLGLDYRAITNDT